MTLEKQRQRQVLGKPVPKRPARLPRSLLQRLVFLALVILLVISIAGYAAIRRTLPTIDGSVRLTGLSASVEVLRDRWGVPHIFASTQRDAFFAQGYAVAQDRLWQMELFRRIGRGSLSEVLGKQTLDTDLLMRTLGLRRTAEQEAALLYEETREMLESYAAGVNAFLTSHLDTMPLEFVILGFRPDPWTIVDSLVWGKVMAWDLGGNWEAELLRASVLGKFGEGVLRELAPPYPSDAPIIVPQGVNYQGFSVFPELPALAHPMGSGADVGSNNWVIDGQLSATGSPMLANDPHLGIQMPGLWYEVQLVAPGLNVAGASFPGVPGVVIGHNENIAWGLTNLGPDVQDLYVEKINPDNPHQYWFRDNWQDMQVIAEEIPVKGQEPVRVEVLATRHGPLLNGAVKGLGQPLALHWTALQPGETTRAVRLLNRAENWQQFRDALRYFSAPSQNFVYADTSGNIGYQAPGWIPIRQKGDGLLPVPGWTGEYEWAGLIPYDQLPSSYNPQQHFLMSANNRVVDDSYPYFLSNDWNPGFRARRIDEMLRSKDKLDLADFVQMQNDVVSLPHRQLAEYLVGLEPRDELSRRAQALVRGWDGELGSDSVAGAIVQTTYLKLLKNLYADPLGDELFKRFQDSEAAMPSLLGLLAEERSLWFTSVRTAALPGPKEVAMDSLRQALDELKQRFGDDLSTWRWGRLHTVTFGHVLGQVQPLDRLFNLGPYEGAGSAQTVNANSFAASKGFAVKKVPSLRIIVDLQDFDRSLFIGTTGQSGQPLSVHYGDMTERWLKGEYHPMLFSRAKVESNLEGKLVLNPA